LLAFGRDLRRSGLNIGSGQILSLVEAVAAIDCKRRDDFYYASKSTLVTSPEQIPVFDAAFARFWRRLTNPLAVNEPPTDHHQFDMPPAPSDTVTGEASRQNGRFWRSRMPTIKAAWTSKASTPCPKT
jgi:uncharacterized protein with von Willebrand factor type A (vWA) domain